MMVNYLCSFCSWVDVTVLIESQFIQKAKKKKVFPRRSVTALILEYLETTEREESNRELNGEEQA
jgi:hypothetical protein